MAIFYGKYNCLMTGFNGEKAGFNELSGNCSVEAGFFVPEKHEIRCQSSTF